MARDFLQLSIIPNFDNSIKLSLAWIDIDCNLKTPYFWHYKSNYPNHHPIMAKVSINFEQADLLRRKILEKYLSENSSERQLKDSSTKIPHVKGIDIVEYFTKKETNLVLGEKAFREDLIRLFWDKDGNRQKDGQGSDIDNAHISREQFIKFGRCVYSENYTNNNSVEFITFLLNQLSPNSTLSKSSKKIDLLRNETYCLFYRKDIDGPVVYDEIQFTETKTIVVKTNTTKDPYKGIYRHFNQDERYLLFKFQHEGKDFWNMVFDLGEEPGRIPEIILGSSYRFSAAGELTSGAVVLSKEPGADLNKTKVGNLVTNFLNREEYAPIKIPKRFFTDASSLEQWLIENTKKSKSLDNEYLGKIAGEYVYFACKVPVESQSPIPEYSRIIKAFLKINQNGSVEFSGPDNFTNEISFQGECQYSSLNEVLQINLYQEKGDRFLTLQAYIKKERLNVKLANSPVIGISIWKEEYLEGKIMALIPKNENDTCEDLGILSIRQADAQGYGALIDNDLLYNGVISYLSGKINRYLHTPKRFHEGPFRPHKQSHREAYFGLAYYLATSCEPTDNSKKLSWQTRVKSALREAYLHGFASNIFAGRPIEDALNQAKQKINSEGKVEPLYEELAQQLEEILAEQKKLKDCLTNEMTDFYEFAKRYWPNLDSW